MGNLRIFIFRFLSVRHRVMGTKLTANLDNFIFNIEHATAFRQNSQSSEKRGIAGLAMKGRLFPCE
jgi:hypothetical protein